MGKRRSAPRAAGGVRPEKGYGSAQLARAGWVLALCLGLGALGSGGAGANPEAQEPGGAGAGPTATAGVERPEEGAPERPPLRATSRSGSDTCTAETPTWVPADTGGPDGETMYRCLRRMPKQTDSRIPLDQRYDLTTFGGPGDEQPVDCGDPRGADAQWYYAANLQRFPCGQKVRLVDTARQRCVIVEVADTGPNICVEEAAGRAAWDVSPLASQHLFGVSSTGWSNKRGVYGAPVSAQNPLGPCDEQFTHRSDVSLGSVGGACEGGAGCSYAGAVCLEDGAGWPHGYCSAPCSGECPGQAGPHALALCSVLGDGSAGCLAACDFTLYDTGCRPGYACGTAQSLTPGKQNQVCLPERCDR